MGRRLPTCRLGAVGSKPQYSVSFAPLASRSSRPGVSSVRRPRQRSSAMSDFSMALSRGLLGVLDGARLADDRDPDLAGVAELVLDAAGDVLRQEQRLLVGDLLVLDDDAHLAPRLDGEGALDPRVAEAQLLEVGEARDVGLQQLAAGARPLRREPVGRVDQVVEHALLRLVAVVRGDGL